MNANLDDSGATPSKIQKHRGAALILVLAFLVLITALVISFFTSVTSELNGAKQYAGGANAKQLADSAVQAVMGTIKLATSGTTTDGVTLAWASQPGMIRTYDTAGRPVAYYKLYSSANLIVTEPGGFDLAAETDATWRDNPALFTDLNSPMVVSGTAAFPIIDGNGIKTMTVSGSSALCYDADADGQPDVEGFSVNATAPVVKDKYNEDNDISSTNTPVPMPVRWIYVLRDGSLTAPTGADATGKIANWTGSPKAPTINNPITGRIAFWTDDDTCKVNINTASEGKYWDFPRTTGTPDKDFAGRQPVNKEFQRYPGHPATTSLSPVFPAFWKGKDPIQANESIYGIIPRVSGSGSMGGSIATAGASVTGTALVRPDNDRLYASIDELMFKPELSGTGRVEQGLTNAQLERSRFFITTNNRSPDVNLFNKPRVSIWPISDTNDIKHRTTFDQILAFCSTSGSNAYYFQRNEKNRDSATADLPASVEYNDHLTGLERNRILMEYLRNLTNQQIPGFGGAFKTKYNAKKSGTGTTIERDQILTEIFDYIHCTNLNDQNLALAAGASAKPFAPAFPSSASWDKWDPMGTGQVAPIVDTTTDTRGFGRFITAGKAFFMFIGSAQNPPYQSGTFILHQGALLTTGSTLASDKPLVTASTTWITPTLAEMNPYNASSNKTGVLSGRIRVQAGFFLDPFVASMGHINFWPKVKVEVEGLDQIKIGPVNTTPIFVSFPTGSGTNTTPGKIVPVMASVGPAKATFSNPPHYPTPGWNIAKICVMTGGNMGFMSLVLGSGTTGSGSYPCIASTATKSGSAYGIVTAETSDLDAPGRDPANNNAAVTPCFYFSGGKVTVTIKNAANTEVIQKLYFNFPSQNFPVPKLAPTNPTEGKVGIPSYDKLGNFRYFATGASTIQAYKNDSDALARKGLPGTGGRLSSGGDGVGIFDPCAWIIDTDVVRSVEVASGDVRMVAAQAVVSDTAFAPHKYYTATSKPMAHSLRGTWNNPYYGATVGRLINLAIYGASLTTTEYTSSCSMNAGKWRYTNNTAVSDLGNPSMDGKGIYVGGAKDPRRIPGDWDNGSGNYPDGPYINRADEGDGKVGGSMAYYEIYSGEMVDTQATLFSPNRQIPSAVTFGSLPSGILDDKAWQTLLFRPLPISHPGLGISSHVTGDGGPPYITPPDHLLLDLFNMPVVEPYPISEPLSTAGRINMNYQIAPFTYINRDTGIRAVLKSEQVISIADSQSGTYKSQAKGANCGPVRYPINMDETLIGFTRRFNNPGNSLNNDLFRSASEICSIHLVPQDGDSNAKYDKMALYWTKHQPTGDNSRERPYATIYPRLTTKSNTFTVHFRVQTLKKSKSTNVATWDERRDAVVGEYRGSQTIERYVDANDPDIPDYADPSKYNSALPIDTFYKFRVLGTKKFTP